MPQPIVLTTKEPKIPLQPQVMYRKEAMDSEYHAFSVIRGLWRTRFDLVYGDRRNPKASFQMDTPFDNTGQVYDGQAFRVHAYDWDREPEWGAVNANAQYWNFAWRDVAVQWYKHSNKMLHINRHLTPFELIDWVQECRDEIHRVTKVHTDNRVHYVLRD